ncbi:MAG: aminoacyl-tRNA hydrolase [Myxococcota bacterium]
MTALHDFYGLWALDASTCEYNAYIPAPQAAVYTILPDGEELTFHVRWTDEEGSVHHMAYASPIDGSPRVVGDGGPSLYSRLDGDALISVVESEGTAVHTTRRTLVDGALRVEQRILTDVGFQETVALYPRTSAKQVLVYRRDLKMRKGKIAAQCAHASMAVFFQRNQGTARELRVPLDGPMASWVGGRFAKICLSVEDEPALLAVHEAARRAGLPTAIITDAGRTEFHGVPTKTAVAIGPAAATEIDRITGPDGLVETKLA